MKHGVHTINDSTTDCITLKYYTISTMEAISLGKNTHIHTLAMSTVEFNSMHTHRLPQRRMEFSSP